MNISYKIKMLDFWSAGSGLSGGAMLDSYAIKDENNLPFIPGKTIKGLLREIAKNLYDESLVKRCFGDEGSGKDDDTKMGSCYFSNAVLPQNEAAQIVDNNLTAQLYEILSFARIDEKTSVAKDKSLREIEVVIPITLEGEILEVKDEFKDMLTNSLCGLKRLGLNRNRGLGRCEVEVIR